MCFIRLTQLAQKSFGFLIAITTYTVNNMLEERDERPVGFLGPWIEALA